MKKRPHAITIGDFGRLGVDDDRNLYWDGQPLQLQQRVSLSRWVNIAIVVGGLSTFALVLIRLVGLALGR